jgi:hypothetical protein
VRNYQHPLNEIGSILAFMQRARDFVLHQIRGAKRDVLSISDAVGIDKSVLSEKRGASA